MSGAQFDKVLEKLSIRETFQNKIFLLLCIPAGIPSVVLGFSQYFTSAEPKEWYCDISGVLGNFTNNFSSYNTSKRCNFIYEGSNGSAINYKCTKWIYNQDEFDETLVTKFDLICDNKDWPARVTSIFYCGSIIGNLFFGWASDRWGRKTMLMPLLFFTTILPLLYTLSNKYIMYGILRLLSGIFFPAIYQIPLILSLELYKPTKRTGRGILMSIAFAVSLILVAAAAYITRNWIYFLLVSTLPQILFISYYWLIPESPRWLLSKNRVDEAEEIIQKMANINKIKIPTNYIHKMQMEISDDTNDQDNVKTSVTMIDMLKYSKVTMRYLIIIYNWATGALIYHGLTYYSAFLDMNIFVSFGVGGVVEILACLVAWIGMEYMGRKNMNILCMMVGGFCCLMTFFFKDSQWITIVLVMSGKLGCSAAFNVFYLYCAELIPTVIRSQAMSIASLVSSVVMLSFPFLIDLARTNKEMPLIVMGALSMIGAWSTVVLPETLNCSLPQTLEDAQAVPTPKIFSMMFLKKNKTAYKPAAQDEPKDEKEV